MNKTIYTYTQFATDVIALVNGEIELTDELAEKISAKADDLLTAQLKKAEYNAAHPSKSKAKGASEATKTNAELLRKALCKEPLTTVDINAKIGTNFNSLQVSNAIKYITDVKVKKTKVIRETVNTKGLRSQREYAAYYID